jgi:hypothetical protein
VGQKGFSFPELEKLSNVVRQPYKAKKATRKSGWPTLATGLMNHKCEMNGQVVETEDGKYIRNFHPMKVNNESSDIEIGNDDNAQLLRFKTIMTLANDKKVDVLVLPECCFDANTQDQVNLLFSSGEFNSHYASVVVIGSSHVCTGGHSNSTPVKQRNRLRLFVKSSGGLWDAFDHFKFNPARGIKLNKNDQEVVDEQLDDTEKILNIICGRDKWSVMPLVCKDFLDTDLAGLWSILRPTLILVSAYSAISGPFETAGVAAASARPLVVVADNGISDDDLMTGVDHSTNRHWRKKCFAMFVIPAGESGNTGCFSEQPFTTIPKFPQLIYFGFANGNSTAVRPKTVGYSSRLRSED